MGSLNFNFSASKRTKRTHNAFLFRESHSFPLSPSLRDCEETRKHMVLIPDSRKNTFKMSVEISVHEKLISEVEMYPWLYNQRRSDYRDVKKRDNTWAEIGRTLSLNADECQKIWRNLRDRYTREIKSQKKPSGSTAETSKPVWPYLRSMDFLRDHVKHRTTKSNFAIRLENVQSPQDGNLQTASDILLEIANGSEDQEETVTIDQPPQPQLDDYSLELHPSGFLPPSSSFITVDMQRKGCSPTEICTPDRSSASDSSGSARSKRHKTNDDQINQELLCVLKNASESVKSSREECQRPHLDFKDSDVLFLLSLSGILKSMPEAKKEEAKVKIQQMLFNLRFCSDE